jgi:hypothetical protein
MADARLKALFKRAAEIADQVPEDFQEAAFHRALDVLIGNDTTREAQSYAEFIDEAAEEAKSAGLTKAAAKLILDKSFDVLNLATGVLGVEALTADQVANVLNDGYGMVVDNEMVSRTLNNADGLVSRVRHGGDTLYRIIQPGRVIPGHRSRVNSAKKKKAASKKKAAGTTRTAAASSSRSTRPSTTRKSAPKKKSTTAKRTQKKK